jgi:tetratricopeptide (TPR) repeat protein
MNTADSSREKELFLSALDLPPAERAAFLDRACGGNSRLREHVELLLRAHEEASSFLQKPAVGADATVRVPVVAEEQAGDRIGRYKLLQRIGEGGCGVVYMAEQEEPVRRRVALKVIKLGMDTKEVIARFEAERQALALMDHPNIARVLDAGATDSGRPFFVMELVRGVPITRFCDENNTPTAQRLELFVQVCHAVQHAHQKGIIHRDLKPSNILVTLNDGVAVPKVIDFGIAKATGGRLTDSTLFTAFEQFIGTPAYMSPEQAVMTSLDIDTRSDVYSLGVLLYELLTGRTPFDTAELLKAGLDTMRRHIREVDPPRPSARLSTLQGEALTTTARQRQIAPPKLINLIRGDLDWIVMRCLEKDRARRYETANSVADDIGRHLHNEPVVARPPSATYRLGKMIRRHKLGFAAGAAVAAALVFGLSLSTWMFFREKAARERAVAAEREQTVQRQRAEAAQAEEARQRTQAEKNEKKARDEAAISRAVSSFLTNDILRVADSSRQDPTEAPRNPDLKVREALDRASEKVGPRFKGQPVTEAAVRCVIGSAYSGVGQYAKAQQHYERAVGLRKAALGEDDYDTLSAMDGLAASYRSQGKLAEAAALWARTVELQTRALGKHSIFRLWTMGSLASVYRVQGKFAEAAALLAESIEGLKFESGPEHPNTLHAMDSLASLYSSMGKGAESKKLRAEILEIKKRTLGPDHPDTRSSKAYLDLVEGRYAEAEPLLAQELEEQKRTLGLDHPRTLTTMGSLAVVYAALGKHAEAATLLAQKLEAAKRAFGPEHLETLQAASILAAFYFDQRKLTEAEKVYVELLGTQKRVFGPEHPATLGTMASLADTYSLLGRSSESRPLRDRVLEAQKRVLGPEHPKTLATMTTLTASYLTQGRYAEAAALGAETSEIKQRVLGPEHPDTLTSMSLLAAAYRSLGQAAEAAKLRVRLLEIQQRVLGPKHLATLTNLQSLAHVKESLGELADAEARLRTLVSLSPENDNARSMLGSVLVKRGNYVEAENLLRPVQVKRDEKEPEVWTTFVTRFSLGGALVGQAKYAEAEPLLVSGAEGLLKRADTIPAVDKERVTEALEQLVRHYTAWDKPAQAAEWRKKLDAWRAANPAKPAANAVPTSA